MFVETLLLIALEIFFFSLNFGMKTADLNTEVLAAWVLNLIANNTFLSLHLFSDVAGISVVLSLHTSEAYAPYILVYKARATYQNVNRASINMKTNAKKT